MRNAITLTGSSGFTYGFVVYDIRANLNPLGAVYAFANVPYFYYGFPSIYYIGRTEDLSVRFDSHHKLPQAERAGANSLLVHFVSSERERISIEADLISSYQPPLNETLKNKLFY